MNDTTPPPGTPGPSDTQGRAGEPAGPTTSDRFFAWLRGLGIARSSDRWFAGVAGGIAAKAKVDPLIVRGVFVVLAILGGPGILLYLAAWLMLPDSSGRIHLEELFRGRASAGTIAAAVVLGVIVVIPAIIWVFRTIFLGPWGWSTWDIVPDWVQVTFGVLWWAVAVPALVIWLIFWFNGRAKGGSPGASAAGEQASNDSDHARQYSTQTGDFADRTSKRVSDWSEEASRKAEDWGRKAEEKSREWEQWGREYHEAHRLGAAHVVITLALALLVGGAGAGWALTQQVSTSLVLTAGLVSGVAVLAVSTVIAGIRGRNSGWVGFLSFCGVIALLFAPASTVLPAHTEVVPFGNSSLHPSSNDGDRGLVSIAGNVTVDLTELHSESQPRVLEVWLLGGNATVVLPKNLPARVTVNLLGGNIQDQRASGDERRQGGVLMSRTIEQHAAGQKSSDLVEVRVRLLGGNVTVQEGNEKSRLLEDRKNEISQLEERITELESAR